MNIQDTFEDVDGMISYKIGHKYHKGEICEIGRVPCIRGYIPVCTTCSCASFLCWLTRNHRLRARMARCRVVAGSYTSSPNSCSENTYSLLFLTMYWAECLVSLALANAPRANAGQDGGAMPLYQASCRANLDSGHQRSRCGD